VTKGAMVNIWLTIFPANSFGSLLSSFKCQNDLWMFPGHKSRDGQPIDPNILLAHHPKKQEKETP
jgi:hypothetical protein